MRKQLWILSALLVVVALVMSACAAPAAAPAAPAAPASGDAAAGGDAAACATKDPVTLQLKWVAQAQFAGYYAAQGEGYYDDECLDDHHQPRRPGHRARAGGGGRPGGLRHQLRAQPALGPGAGHQPGQHRPGLRAQRHARDFVEGHGHPKPGRPEGQEGGRLVRRQRVRAAGHAGQGWHRQGQGRGADPAALRHEPAAGAPGGRRRGHDLQRAGPGAGDRRTRPPASSTSWTS